MSAAERLRQHTFELRGESTKVGKVEPSESWVKVGRDGERFWCKVESDENGTLTVVVDNILVGMHGIRHGDRLTLQREHVLEVATLSDMLNFTRMAREAGSTVGGALAWRQQRIDTGASVARDGPLVFF